MTETETETETGGGLAGRTRAELLELCRARGLAATGWRKELMLQALETGEAPAAAPRARPAGDNALARQLAARQEEGNLDAERRKLKERLELHNGPCGSVNGCPCEAWEPGGTSSFNWPICGACTHTRHSHAKVEPSLPPGVV